MPPHPDRPTGPAQRGGWSACVPCRDWAWCDRGYPCKACTLNGHECDRDARGAFHAPCPGDDLRGYYLRLGHGPGGIGDPNVDLGWKQPDNYHIEYAFEVMYRSQLPWFGPPVPTGPHIPPQGPIYVGVGNLGVVPALAPPVVAPLALAPPDLAPPAGVPLIVAPPVLGHPALVDPALIDPALIDPALVNTTAGPSIAGPSVAGPSIPGPSTSSPYFPPAPLPPLDANAAPETIIAGAASPAADASPRSNADSIISTLNGNSMPLERTPELIMQPRSPPPYHQMFTRPHPITGEPDLPADHPAYQYPYPALAMIPFNRRLLNASSRFSKTCGPMLAGPAVGPYLATQAGSSKDEVFVSSIRKRALGSIPVSESSQPDTVEKQSFTVVCLQT
ncbi:hypothetical protein BJ170DRAFT_680742 [Xylariales sp. AK1849]|nr:hypothetical protein BJ170DRAFT_680742 [Xylariales sp. AK1849]